MVAAYACARGPKSIDGEDDKERDRGKNNQQKKPKQPKCHEHSDRGSAINICTVLAPFT